MMVLARDLAPAERDALVKARDEALAAIHSFADRLEKRLPTLVDFAPMALANYKYYLKHVLLLPLDAGQVDMLGRAELARYRALESLLADPSLADPNPARSKNIPPDQASFLAAYESPRAGDDLLPERPPADHAPGLPRPVRNSAAARSVQTDEPGQRRSAETHRQRTASARFVRRAREEQLENQLSRELPLRIA